MNPVAEKLQTYYRSLPSHVKERQAAQLILEAITEINHLQAKLEETQANLERFEP